ncbi:MAG: hypothetical protein ACE5JC_10995, partial [Candidatus Zixiibacteriota bacterium]
EKKNAGLKAVTDFRIMKQHISNARKANRVPLISKRLREFTKNDALTLDHLEIKSASVQAAALNLIRAIDKLIVEISRIDIEEYYGEESLWKKLRKLNELIEKKLIKADRNR